jgi:hypothetical protein
MWKRIKALACFLFRRKNDDGGRPARNTEAKAYLDQYRRDELSIAAAFRRGEAVTRAPGATTGASAVKTGERPHEPRKSTAARDADGTRSSSEQTEDFGTSFAYAEATGSAAIGFLAGGSLTGAVLGAEVAASDGS